MKVLFDAADVYLKQSTWKDLGLVKFCLFSIGLLCGLFAKAKDKKFLKAVSFVVFITTYVALMADFLPMLKNEFDKNSLEKEITVKE